jgi:hypothetical protein
MDLDAMSWEKCTFPGGFHIPIGSLCFLGFMKLRLSFVHFHDTQLIVKKWVYYTKLLPPYDLRVCCSLFKTCENSTLTSLRTHNREVMPPVCILECRAIKLEICSSVFEAVVKILPVKVGERSKAWTVFGRSNTGIAGSNPTWGMNICVHLLYVCAVLCVQIAALRRADPLSKESCLLCIGLRNWKSSQGPTKGL